MLIESLTFEVHHLDLLHGFARFPEFWLPTDGAFL